MTRQKAVIEILEPYFKDKSICGVNNKTGDCEYYTSDGRTCAFGSALKNPEEYANEAASIDILITDDDQSILKEKYQGLFTLDEWTEIQITHDTLACCSEHTLKLQLDDLRNVLNIDTNIFQKYLE